MELDKLIEYMKHTPDFQLGYKHGISKMEIWGKEAARSIVRYKPHNDYERGKVFAARVYLLWK